MLEKGWHTYILAVLSSADILRKNLILLRDRHNITQEQAAAASGLEYKYYQSLEAGRRSQIRLVTLDKLAVAYGLPSAGLLSTELPPSQLVPMVGPIGRLRKKPVKRKQRRRRRKGQKNIATSVEPVAVPSPLFENPALVAHGEAVDAPPITDNG